MSEVSDYSKSAMMHQGDILSSFFDVSDEKIRNAISSELVNLFVDIVCSSGCDTILEIGAHEGTFSRRIKERLPTARVIAFEANPLVFDSHKNSLAQAGVEYHNLLIGEAEGTAELRVPNRPDLTSRLSMGSIRGFYVDHGEVVHSVKSIRLDEFLSNNASENIAIWMDVEGAVDAVLSGAQKTMSQVKLMYVEVEEYQLWPGQMLDHQIFSLIAGMSKLLPQVRDIQRPSVQYNVILTPVMATSRPEYESALKEYWKKLLPYLVRR